MTEYMVSIARVKGRDADGDRELESVLDTNVGDGSQMASAVLQLVAGLLGINIANGLTVDLSSASDDAFRQQDADRAEREQAAESDGKPRRTRRTKAQIEEDKRREAEAADGARDGRQAGWTSPAGSVPGPQPLPPTNTAAPAAQPVDAAAPAQPIYNPFGS
jgi:hypothetical protein